MSGAVVERGRQRAAADAVEPPITDWVMRLFAATRVSPIWIGLGLAAVFLAVCLGVRLTADEPGPALWRNPYVWSDFLNAVLFAYFPTASWMLRRGRQRDLRDLRDLRYLRRYVWLPEHESKSL